MDKIDFLRNVNNEIDFLRNVNNISLNNKISHLSVFYLMSLEHEFNNFKIHISAEEMSLLVAKNFIRSNKITNEGLNALNSVNKIEQEVVLNYLPKLKIETANIVKRLASHFLGNMFKGNNYKKYNEHCNDVIMAPFFFIFMQMFPSSNTASNEHWDKHFSTTWTNVNLRRVTTMTIKNFKKVWKSKDIGLFLLGTYLFIKGSHNQEKNVYFVKSLENYWKEYEYWYDLAEEMLNKGELSSFTQPPKPKNTNNIIMI